MTPTDPPALATALLERVIPPRTAAGLLGDLSEEYRNGRSRRWYWQQAIIALTLTAWRELRDHKLQAGKAIVVGYLCGASLCYVTTSLAAQLIAGYTAYILFVPLTFLSAAASGWVVGRYQSGAMVLVWSIFCEVASIIALALYAVLPVASIPLPHLSFILTANFILAPIGVLVGGLGSPPPANSRPVGAH